MLPAATVDANGRYAEAEPMGPLVSQFAFEQVDGQWRISAAPDGIVLTGSSFEQTFTPYSLYFFDPTFGYLVPDLRWFPSPSLARRIVTALLVGPAEWLAPGVVTEFPNGTRLGPDGVRIEGNQVIVDLSPEAGQADDERLQRMQLQLQQSLAEVTSVTSLSISINQVDVLVPDSGQPDPSAEPAVDSRTPLMREGEFGYYDLGDMVPIEGISPAVSDLGATSVALSNSGQYAALGAPAGVYAVGAAGQPLLVDTRPGLVAPGLDNLEFIWSAQTSSPSTLIAIDQAGTQHPIAAQWPTEGTVQALEVSRDGARHRHPHRER